MELDKICKQNGLLQRGSAYFFQARIPKDCIAFFPKAVIREKLTANNATDAKAQVRQKWAGLEATFERIRTTGSPHKQALTEEDTQHILAAVISSRVGAAAESRHGGLTEDGFERLAGTIAELDQVERKAASRGDTKGIQQQAADWLQGYGYDIPEDSPQFRSFALRFAEASHQATKLLAKQQQGEFIETPEAPQRVAA